MALSRNQPQSEGRSGEPTRAARRGSRGAGVLRRLVVHWGDGVRGRARRGKGGWVGERERESEHSLEGRGMGRGDGRGGGKRDSEPLLVEDAKLARGELFRRLTALLAEARDDIAAVASKEAEAESVADQ